MKNSPFLEFFPNHQFRYIDPSKTRATVVSSVERKDLNDTGYDAYFTVNGFSSPNATRDKLININAFWVDIDGRKDEEELELIKQRLLPTFIVETMNGHHIYWVLDEPIYKAEISAEGWNKTITEWEILEKTIVATLNGDKNAQDITRILRPTKTLYWKGTGELWKIGPKGAKFTIKGKEMNGGARYTMQEIAEAFPLLKTDVTKIVSETPTTKSMEMASRERVDFFNRVDSLYPIEERDSFKAIISGAEGTIPPTFGRNNVLIVAGSLMRMAKWDIEKAYNTIIATGWHGMASERGGKEEIRNTLQSAYKGGYTYSKNHPVISHNTTPEESLRMTDTYAKVFKDRKEADKTFFATYEHVLAEKYPYIVKNEANLFFEYRNGVYKEIIKQELIDRIFVSLEEDMLWGYRSNKYVSDKFSCWASFMKPLVINSDEDILNVKNGLLNIKTRELMPHSPAYVTLYQMPVEYDPIATCPTWDQCMIDWTEGEEAEQKRKVLQQYVAYCLTPSMKYQKALFLVGDGGHGKSTFTDTIRMFIGREGTSSIDLEQLNDRFGASGLLGKRLNIVEEVSGDYIYQSHKLKRMISGEEITAEKKNHPYFCFTPTAKFIFACNNLPRVDDSSTASERRMIVVFFNTSFRDNARVDLRSNIGLLAQEMSGILNWALDGVALLNELGGFIKTNEQVNGLKEYRKENSSVEGFIADCTEKKDRSEVDSSRAYELYTIYCKKSGLKAQSRIRFTKHLKTLGDRTHTFTYLERSSGHIASRYEGFRITDEWDTFYLDNGRVVERSQNSYSLDQF